MTGGYALASHLHISGPLAMVVTVLIVGNHGRTWGMSDTTRRYVDMFWELLDEILNAVLFVLIGMEVLPIHFSLPVLAAGAIAIIVTLLLVRLAKATFEHRSQLFGGCRTEHAMHQGDDHASLHAQHGGYRLCERFKCLPEQG